MPIFDSYCHPEWLPLGLKRRYHRRRRKEREFEEAWTRKVILKGGWAERCLDRGHFLVS